MKYLIETEHGDFYFNAANPEEAFNQLPCEIAEDEVICIRRAGTECKDPSCPAYRAALLNEVEKNCSFPKRR